MADDLIVYPASRFLGGDNRAWLESEGCRLPSDAASAHAPSVDGLRSIMLEMGWAFTEHRDGGNWYAMWT